MILLVLYLMAASASWGAMTAWTFDRDEGFDPLTAAALFMLAMIVPFAAAAFFVIRWLGRVSWKMRRWIDL